MKNHQLKIIMIIMIIIIIIIIIIITVISIVISALGTVTKGLVQALENEWRLSKLQYYKNRPEY